MSIKICKNCGDEFTGEKQLCSVCEVEKLRSDSDLNAVSKPGLYRVDDKQCKHKIGIYYYWDDTDIVTLEELKKKIKETQIFKEEYPSDDEVLHTLLDYCDRRKETNFEQFNFCPLCGAKIDWEKIKRSAE